MGKNRYFHSPHSPWRAAVSCVARDRRRPAARAPRRRTRLAPGRTPHAPTPGIGRMNGALPLRAMPPEPHSAAPPKSSARPAPPPASARPDAPPAPDPPGSKCARRLIAPTAPPVRARSPSRPGALFRGRRQALTPRPKSTPAAVFRHASPPAAPAPAPARQPKPSPPAPARDTSTARRRASPRSRSCPPQGQAERNSSPFAAPGNPIMRNTHGSPLFQPKHSPKRPYRRASTRSISHRLPSVSG